MLWPLATIAGTVVNRFNGVAGMLELMLIKGRLSLCNLKKAEQHNRASWSWWAMGLLAGMFEANKKLNITQ